jgi:hypothetical protein
VTVTPAPAEFALLLPSHLDNPTPDACQLTPTGAAGVSSCALLARASSEFRAYVPNVTATLAAGYGGDAFHTVSGARVSVPTTTVYGCDFVGDGYKEICDAKGFVLIGGPRGNGGHTASVTAAIGKAHVMVTVPRDCVQPHAMFSVKVSFRGRVSVRRVLLILRSLKRTLTRAPYVATFKNPSGQNGDFLVIQARVTSGPRHGRQTTKTVRVFEWVC